jgi:hypothetical protein
VVFCFPHPAFAEPKGLVLPTKQPTIGFYPTFKSKAFCNVFNNFFVAAPCPTSKLETTPCQLSVTAYSLHSQPSSESGVCLTSLSLQPDNVSWQQGTHFTLGIAVRLDWSLSYRICELWYLSNEKRYRHSFYVSVAGRGIEIFIFTTTLSRMALVFNQSHVLWVQKTFFLGVKADET